MRRCMTAAPPPLPRPLPSLSVSGGCGPCGCCWLPSARLFSSASPPPLPLPQAVARHRRRRRRHRRRRGGAQQPSLKLHSNYVMEFSEVAGVGLSSIARVAMLNSWCKSLLSNRFLPSWVFASSPFLWLAIRCVLHCLLIPTIPAKASCLGIWFVSGEYHYSWSQCFNCRVS